MYTVDDFINTLEDLKKRHTEFGKYIICVDASSDEDVIPVLKDPNCILIQIQVKQR